MKSIDDQEFLKEQEFLELIHNEEWTHEPCELSQTQEVKYVGRFPNITISWLSKSDKIWVLYREKFYTLYDFYKTIGKPRGRNVLPLKIFDGTGKQIYPFHFDITYDSIARKLPSKFFANIKKPRYMQRVNRLQ